VARQPHSPTENTSVWWWEDKGDGTFAPSPGIAMSGTVHAIGAADLNGDGFLDAVATIQGVNGTQPIVLLGNGDGTFQAPALIRTNSNGTAITISDLDGDGIPDLVLGSCCGLAEATYMLVCLASAMEGSDRKSPFLRDRGLTLSPPRTSMPTESPTWRLWAELCRLNWER
jgi:hypothetical protein